MTTFSLYAVRSKKSKRFLKLEISDYDSSKYYDSVSIDDIEGIGSISDIVELPTVFSAMLYIYDNNPFDAKLKPTSEVTDILKFLRYPVFNHTNDDLEMVKIGIEIKE